MKARILAVLAALALAVVIASAMAVSLDMVRLLVSCKDQG